MKIKRLISTAVLCVIVALGSVLLGCGGKKDDPDAIYIMIANEGYGYKWLETVGNVYEERTGVHVDVAPISIEGQISNQLLSPKNNNIDIYFNISGAENFYGNLAKGSALVSGYDTIFADISDVYDYVPEGYGSNKSIRELITPYALRNNTFNGKQYGFSWSNGINGLVYNADLFEKYGLEEPKTTDELLALCKAVNNKYTNTNGRPVYAFNWSPGYWYHLSMMWWFQYEGAETYAAYCEGKDVSGQYTPEILRQRGKFEAYNIIGKIIDIDDGYSNPNCTSYSFTQSQLRFLEGEAFMMPNGDWLEREMEANFEPGEVTIKMMKTPVNSRIVDKLTTVDDDVQLSEIVEYIDNGKNGTLSKQYSQTDIDFIDSARHIISSQCNMHQAYIPSYSNNIDGAKEFIKFLYDKEIQEIIIKNSHGNSFSVSYDFSAEPFYSELSDYKKSVDKILLDPDVFMVGKEMWGPIYYLGGLFHQVESQQVMAIAKSSPSYRTAVQLWNDQYSELESRFDEMMARAGVSN